jgi:hypothetical protein
MRPYLENTQPSSPSHPHTQKKAGKMAKVVEKLPHKSKALSSNPSTAKKKKRQRREKAQINKIKDEREMESQIPRK